MVAGPSRRHWSSVRLFIDVSGLFQCHRSNSSSPVDRLSQQPRLTKLTRTRTDKKSEFLKALKRDRVEEEHEDESRAGSEKVTASLTGPLGCECAQTSGSFRARAAFLTPYFPCKRRTEKFPFIHVSVFPPCLPFSLGVCLC